MGSQWLPVGWSEHQGCCYQRKGARFNNITQWKAHGPPHFPGLVPAYSRQDVGWASNSRYTLGVHREMRTRIKGCGSLAAWVSVDGSSEFEIWLQASWQALPYRWYCSLCT